MFTLKVFEELLEFCVQLNPEQLCMAETDVFTLVPTFHRPFDVHVVVFNDAEDNITSAYAFSSLGGHEFTSGFNVFVDVFHADTAIGDIVVSYVVDVVFLYEVQSNDPGAGTDNLVDPLAVVQNFRPFKLVHYNLALLGNSLLVA